LIRKVGVLYHPMIEDAHVKAEQIREFLVDSGVSPWLCSAWEMDEARSHLDGTGLILSIGGDGTILRAASIVIPELIPIVGVNLGKLGFMTELSADKVVEKLPLLLSGNGWIDERALLTAEIIPGDGEPPQTFHALNDVVVARGEVPKLIRIDVSINGQQLTPYRADGIILATATGSTGYSLAAGGPILDPRSTDFLMVPVCTHFGSASSMVLLSTSVVRLRVATVHQAVLSIDGHENMPLTDDAVVTVKHSPYSARFLRIHPKNSFYSYLEKRLKGKQQIDTGRKS